ncbi:MerR family transcriptional regulator [Actinomadura formosensis]|uniref:MerR family transcriptional regulator n=1 Tax=Actinomadura formosensis TaxID=60706 RepID=UPI00082E1186|nr:MerR family transcriptional regulator [Actinomadura formosensis]
MTLRPDIDVQDTTERLAWGWIAALHGLEEGPWLTPTIAAGLLDLPASRLRSWADKGVITCLRPEEKGRHRRYFGPELVRVLQIHADRYPPMLRTLREHIDQLLGGEL